MKTLSEIIEFAKDGGMPTHEECYWALLALDALDNLNFKRLMDLCRDIEKDSKNLKMRGKFASDGAFRSIKTAMSVTPKHWLGPSHDPSTEECQKWRKIAKGLLNHVTSAPHNPS